MQAFLTYAQETKVQKSKRKGNTDETFLFFLEKCLCGQKRKIIINEMFSNIK